MKAALYVRTSTNDQTTENQERELRAVAARLGHHILEVYADNGISGAKGRDRRPAFDRLCRDVTRRRFDIIMVWSVDRLGRSLQDLVGFLSEIHASRVELYLHVQGLDTTTPAGRATPEDRHAIQDHASRIVPAAQGRQSDQRLWTECRWPPCCLRVQAQERSGSPPRPYASSW